MTVTPFLYKCFLCSRIKQSKHRSIARYSCKQLPVHTCSHLRSVAQRIKASISTASFMESVRFNPHIFHKVLSPCSHKRLALRYTVPYACYACQLPTNARIAKNLELNARFIPQRLVKNQTSFFFPDQEICSFPRDDRPAIDRHRQGRSSVPRSSVLGEIGRAHV